MTALAAKIAAVAADRHHLSAGAVMVNGFVLNRFYINGRNNAVRQVIQSAITIDMSLAKTALTISGINFGSC